MWRTALAGARMLRSGNIRERFRILRDGMAAIRVSAAGAALRTGVLVSLENGPRDAESLSRAIGATDSVLVVPFLRTLEEIGLIRSAEDRWTLTRRARALLADPLARAAGLAYGGYQCDLYRGLPDQLAGGPPRRDIAEEGETIAQLSIGFQPFLEESVRATTARVRPSRVLDVGCGAGHLLALMLAEAPSAVGLGIDNDAGAVRIARDTIAKAGVTERAQVLEDDAASLARRLGELGGPVDLLLLANVIYYVPVESRVAFLTTLASMLQPGGTLLLVTTAAVPDHFSRHFDLLLRAQGLGMELPVLPKLREQALAAGFRNVTVRRLAPGLPLFALTGVRGGA
jgi:SAM-dependent methyltransferase